MRGSTRLTNFLSARMPSLQSVPIRAEHGLVYGDLRLPIYHSVLAGSRVVDESEDLIMRTFNDKGDVAYDIGALAGIYTLALADYVGDTGKVFVFEPNSTLLPTLSRTCDELSNAVLFPVALSDHEGLTTLFVPVDDASMTSLSDWTGGVGGEVKETVCEMKRLDDLIERENIPFPDFVKCDVEGAEIAVFRGAKNTLGRAEAPVILFEINPQATTAFGAGVNEPAEFLLGLENAKYKLYEIKDGGLAEFEDAGSLVIENGFFTNVVGIPNARRDLLSRLATK